MRSKPLRRTSCLRPDDSKARKLSCSCACACAAARAFSMSLAASARASSRCLIWSFACSNVSSAASLAVQLCHAEKPRLADRTAGARRTIARSRAAVRWVSKSIAEACIPGSGRRRVGVATSTGWTARTGPAASLLRWGRPCRRGGVGGRHCVGIFGPGERLWRRLPKALARMRASCHRFQARASRKVLRICPLKACWGEVTSRSSASCNHGSP
mmetsp:Transcript_17732/g.31024  ORF Transcript_17732/g.31024 Transcript_17732/m.31024 type:complete len:214 (-) Transcript_17732:112-753(-)